MTNTRWISQYGAQIAADFDSALIGDTNIPHLWVDAAGTDVFKVLLDYTDEPVDDSSGEFIPRNTITRVEAGAGESTFGPTDGVGGYALIQTDVNENDGINAQFRGESFKLNSSSRVHYSIRFKISEATQSDYFFGLAITDTDILGGVTDRIGFEKLDGSTSVTALMEKNSVETQVTAVMTQDADQWHTLAMFVDGPSHRVYFFVDNALTATAASFANLPDDEELRLSRQVLAGSAAAVAATIDWERVIQIGGRA